MIKAIFAFFFGIYDFFVGDWRLLVGAVVTVALVLALLYLPALSALKPFAGWVFAFGALATLTVAVFSQRPRK